MVDATGVSGNVSADYSTLQSMYAKDGNNISDDSNAMDYAKAFETEAKQQGDTNEADKASAAETGQTNVDFHGGANADKAASEKTSQGQADKDISDAADKLRAAGNTKAATDLTNAEAGNDQHAVRKILDENAGTKGFSDQDKSTAMQGVDVKDLENDMKTSKGLGQVNNDVSNFKKDGGTDDQLKAMGLPTSASDVLMSNGK